jgi:hypothetical protein
MTQEQFDRIYSHLDDADLDDVKHYLRKAAAAQMATADALKAYGVLSADARQALKTAEAEGLLAGDAQQVQ